MVIGPEISLLDLAAIRQLIPIDSHEIRHFANETRLRFNSPTAVRCFVLSVETRGRKGDVELFHWVVDDVWELVHSDV